MGTQIKLITGVFTRQHSGSYSDAIEVVVVTLTNNTHYVSRISTSSVHEGYRYGNIVSWVCSNVNHSAALYHTLCLVNHCIPSSLTLCLNCDTILFKC